MKICLYLQRRFTFLGHEIAKQLKESYGVSDFCCYVQLKYAEKFIKEQKDINYSTILCDTELHAQADKEQVDWDYIKKFEKKYGVPNIWPYIGIDRSLTMSVPKYDYMNKPMCSYEKMLVYLQVKSKAIIEMLEKEKPDVVILALVGSMPSMILYQLAKKMGIRTINIDDVRMEDYVTLSDNCFCNFTKVNETFVKLQNGEAKTRYLQKAKEFIKKLDEKEIRYKWYSEKMKQQKTSPIKFLLLEMKGFIRHSINYYKNSKGDYGVQSPFWFFYNKLLRFGRRIRGYKRFYSEPDLDRDFVFFPLHHDPETATMLLAPFNTDQLNLIRNIAKSLPGHFVLYVKEHPGMIYFRPNWYYKKLQEIPNVKILDPNVSSIKLVKKAKLVTTVTGTAGLEAALLGKPVLTFGEVFYNTLSTVKRIKCIEDLPKIVKETIENHKTDKQESENFVAATFEHSQPINYNQLWEGMNFESGELEKMTTLFATELNLKPAQRRMPN